MHAFFKRKSVKILFIIILVLVVIRLILPSVVLHYANKTLDEMKGYHGHIEDIDLALIRGAYKIDSMYLNKIDEKTNKETPFFAVHKIDLSVEWGAIVHGKLVGKLTFDEPVLRFTKDKVEPDKVRKDSSSFKTLLKKFMPLDVNKFEVNRGRLQYKDEGSKPKVDIQMTNLHIIALNLRNSYDSKDILPATVNATTDIYEGVLTFNMKLNPLADDPTFDMNAELKNTNLVNLNEFFDAYASIKVSRGTFGLYTEVAAKDGEFKGYVKPIIQHLKVLGNETKHDNILKKIWEGLVGTVASAFTNHKKHQFATKIPFQGSLKSPRTNTWYTIGHILQNAFIRAIVPSIDDEININSVPPKEEKKTVIEKIFGGKKGDKKEEDKKGEKKK